MNFTPKLTVLEVAKYLGLGVEYATDLLFAVHGCLEAAADPRFILINPNQPAFEQRFTIAHRTRPPSASPQLPKATLPIIGF